MGAESLKVPNTADGVLTMSLIDRDEGLKNKEVTNMKIVDMRRTKKSVEYLLSFDGAIPTQNYWISEKNMNLKELSLVQSFKKQDREMLAEELDKGLEPEKIIGLSKINGRSVALLKWRENESLRRKQAINQASYISKWVIEERYPNLLVELFEHGFQKASYQYMEDVWHHF
ncbi:unnamed protein product [Enterobius vermicularis]|uniref:Chromo domain-containing protein n=1 Tax=Enterobius vermicularis TaxID=51028 RepID=A0A0N4V2W1_ENTVE|nr:unnamed protein product [Enterobius vermicularis]